MVGIDSYYREEEIANINITSFVAERSALVGYDTYNWFGSNTNFDKVVSAANGVGEDNSIAFYTGDGRNESVFPLYEPQWYLATNAAMTEKIYDHDIYWNGGATNNLKFAFLYACNAGDTKGGVHWSGVIFGMPLAWSGRILSDDGYLNPDGSGRAVIAFADKVPWLSADDWWVPNAPKNQWLRNASLNIIHLFYNLTLQVPCYPVKDALDEVARRLWGYQDFGQSHLYNGYRYYDHGGNEPGWRSGRMRLFGDGNILIGRGRGCPYVYVWDGQRYVIDNNILPSSEISDGRDVEDYYIFEQTPMALKQGTAASVYPFQIREFEQEHSYLDKIQLLAVDHSPDVNVAVTQRGKILTYANSSPPISCEDADGVSRLNEISKMDGDVFDEATFYEGYPGDFLTLNFGKIAADDAKLIVRTDMKKTDECIEVQLKNETGLWNTVEVLIPRSYWSIEAVDLSDYVDRSEDLQVRLRWKDHHCLDYVGLDVTPNAMFTVEEGVLLSARHSTQGNVRSQLLKSDQNYAELYPDQNVDLRFLLPNSQGKTRTFILCSVGRYIKNR